MRKIITAGLTALAIGTGIVAPTVAADAAKMPTVKLPASVSKPCKYEDSVNCYWDAGRFGNHRGHSFIVRKMPGKAGMVCVLYVARKDRHMDYCS